MCDKKAIGQGGNSLYGKQCLDCADKNRPPLAGGERKPGRLGGGGDAEEDVQGGASSSRRREAARAKQDTGLS